MFIGVLLFLFVCVLVTLLFYKSIYDDYWKRRNILQLGEIFIGFIFGDRSISEIYKEIYDKYPTEKYIGNFNGANKGLILRDLRDVQSVLTNDFESFHSRGIPVIDGDILGDNLLSISDYNRWKLIRQKVSPIFTSAKLKNMCFILEKCASDYVEMLKNNKEMRDQPFNSLYTYTTASIAASVFGIDTNIKSSMDSPFLEMTRVTLEPSFRAIFLILLGGLSPTLYRLFNCKFFGLYEDFFVGVVKKVLSIRRNAANAGHDFIALCLELQKNGTMRDPTTGYEVEATDEVMAAQAFFFFLAGTETSASTMHFALLELASNPPILKRLHEEIDKAFEKCNEKINYDVIESMQYLDMILSEVGRKYPAIGVMQRECTKTTVLPAGNLKVEKGVVVAIPVLAIHRDPKYFPNPEVFDPERFAPENVGNIKKFTYMPFGEGKRICIGARYARLQVKAGLMYLLRSFTLKEQNYRPKNFEKSAFAIRDTKARYDFIPRFPKSNSSD